MEECPTRRPMKEALMAATSSRTRLHALSTAATTAICWTGRRWLSWPVTWRTNVTPSTWNTGLSNQRGGAWWHTFDNWLRVFSRGGLTVPSQRWLTRGRFWGTFMPGNGWHCCQLTRHHSAAASVALAVKDPALNLRIIRRLVRTRIRIRVRLQNAPKAEASAKRRSDY